MVSVEFRGIYEDFYVFLYLEEELLNCCIKIVIIVFA